ncbi:MAG: YqiA/YcfP family alpha/beta fold hydrolase [Inhella sp.]|uniref:YqiA/YcfP family alpha/beta fold hydrolase n=1 Tax=Inhella sp. TaxID=1921806 RepID=UPI0022C52AE5|nr:YqiA/YcfP family alpha/beta fold hydrolase [Inhella sp.]MCZ8236277.1 esterase [Inhella sp.]
MSTLTHLLYLHGFRSSPQSAKAQRMRAWAQTQNLHWSCPALPPSPAQAMAEVMALVGDWPDTGCAVVGSSLGGFYAAWVGQQRPNWRVGLLNPAVSPARDLAAYIGENRQWHAPESSFFFRPEYVTELQRLHAGRLSDAPRWMALIAKGDEVLDWRDMLARYGLGRVLLLGGSDHALSDFARWQPEFTRHLLSTS